MVGVVKKAESRSYEVTITTSPTLICDTRIERADVLIENSSATDAKIGPIASEIFKPFKAGEVVTIDTYLGQIYGQVASGTASAVVWEVG
jgi:hypothetical protein